jgi:hypothetical protein
VLTSEKIEQTHAESVYSRPDMKCPWCKQDCSGTEERGDYGQQLTGYSCDNCFSVQISPFDSGPYAAEEWENGWCFPDEYDRYQGKPKMTADEYLQSNKENMKEEAVRLLREFTVWAIVSQFHTSPTQANRIIDGDGLWPSKDEPSNDSLIKRSIRTLSALK